MLDQHVLAQAIQRNVSDALQEDVGSGDLTAQLIPVSARAYAHVISREAAVLCGQAWFEACFRSLDEKIEIVWHAQDGDILAAGQKLCELHGNARAILTAERAGLNFLQTLSATATQARQYVTALAGAASLVMDTRKTLPGLRVAQKYAVRMGGGSNQRIGLFDGILIKENHIAAAGGISEVLAATRNATVPVQIEVENMAELASALDAGARLILLDNFNIDQLYAAIALTAGRAVLEASGGIALADIPQIAATGVQRISIGSMTKHIRAIDLSLRIDALHA
jgi:nicotinate-nucleotide pyrophosphorylase (carboxylating)